MREYCSTEKWEILPRGIYEENIARALQDIINKGMD